MKRIYYIILGIVVAVAAVAGFIYNDTVYRLWERAAQNLEEFRRNDISNNINQIANQIFAPGPLKINGKANASSLSAAKVVAHTNIQRFDNGTLPPLTVNAKLEAAALAKAQDMFQNQYFEHVSPSGVDPSQLVKNSGYEYIITGENLILGNFKDEAEMVQLWMDSPGHRANILNTRYSEIGVAVVRGQYKGEMVWIGVQEFGLPLSDCPSPDKAAKTTLDANLGQLDQLSGQIEAKRNEIDNTSPRSPQYNALVDQYNSLVRQYNALSQETKAIINQYNASVKAFNDCIAGT